MYRRSTPGQLSFENFYLPFGGNLSGENRWIKLAELIPWDSFENEYAEQFSQGQGAPAKTFRMALGALIIKEKLGTSDEETVEQIRENPYLQYFLGLSEYTDKAPFEASMMVHFRKRLNIEIVGRINEQIANQTIGGKQDKNEDNDNEPPNQGKLILDASCAPADIRYPTDLNLLNQAREQTENIIDALYEQVKDQIPKKPRTYRRQARKAYLQIAKQRKVNSKKIRKAVREQLGYLRRNLGHIDTLLATGASLSRLSKYLYRNLLVVSEVFRQQQWMFQHHCHRIEARIVSLAQPHVRPIVRGKAGTPVEFGAKISVSCVDGKVFLDHLSWDNFNESGDFQQQVESFRSRFGHYPESVHVDQIYRTRDNRAYCRDRGIRISGPPLGRPAIQDLPEIRKQSLDDAKVRNQIEGKFGQGKRRFSLGRVMAKLAATSETAIAITFFVMNLEWLLKQLLLFFISLLTFGRKDSARERLGQDFDFSTFYRKLRVLTDCDSLFAPYLPISA